MWRYNSPEVIVGYFLDCWLLREIATMQPHLNPTLSPRGKYYYSHVIDEETKVQRTWK